MTNSAITNAGIATLLLLNLRQASSRGLWPCIFCSASLLNTSQIYPVVIRRVAPFRTLRLRMHNTGLIDFRPKISAEALG